MYPGYCTLILVALSLVAASCARPAPPEAADTPQREARPVVAKTGWEAEWQQLTEAAKKEGKLMIYSTPSGDVIRELASAFENKFGVAVEFISGRGEELTRRIEGERGAGLYLVDVVMSGGPTILTTMKPAGIMDKLEPQLLLPEVTDPGAWVTGNVPFLDKDRTAMEMAAWYGRYVLRNTDLVREGEITSYKDILNPKWKGKITFNDPTVTGTGNAFLTLLAMKVWGVEETKRFMRQFASQEPAITRDRRLQAEWVARGKYQLSIATNNETASEFVRLGSPLAYVKVTEGAWLSSGAGGLGIPLKRPHPNAARVFVNWLLSKEGHAKFIKAFGVPGARRDAPREGIHPDLFPEPDEKFYMNTEDSILFRTEIIKMAREILAPLLK